MKKSSETWHEKYTVEVSERQTCDELRDRNAKLEEDIVKANLRAAASENLVKEHRNYTNVAQLEQAKAEAALAKGDNLFIHFNLEIHHNYTV